MKILALEFSSPQRSVAVVQARSGATTSVSEVIESGRESRPFAMIEDALRQAQLEREQIESIALGLGPGSYTGIRAALALAQGWQLARDIKLIPVGSADAVATQAHADGIQGSVHVVIDAQRGEFYLATYAIKSSGTREVEKLRLATHGDVREQVASGGLIVGPEVAKWFPAGRVIFPRAAIIGKLALQRPPCASREQIEPIYLRETNFVKAPPPRILP